MRWLLTGVLFSLFISCNENKNSPSGLPEASSGVVAAEEHRPARDSVKEPEVVQAGIPNVNRVGAPKVTPINPNRGYVGGVCIMQNYTTDDGLALDAISCAIRDKMGNIWYATQGAGVSRYDGKSFTNFTTSEGLAHNIVKVITEDKEGNLWFGTYGAGVSKYDGRSFVSFNVDQGLAGNIILSSALDRKGRLWFGTLGGGVSCYDGQPKDGNGPCFTNFTTAQGLADNIVISIAEDKEGNLWFGTAQKGLSCFDGKSFANFSTAQGLGDSTVWSILEDSKGVLWFGTEAGGVSRCSRQAKTGNAVRFVNFTTSQGLAGNYVNCITEDKRGNLWFGTTGSGVSLYDVQTRSDSVREDMVHFTNFTTEQGLANNSLASITEDETGNIWFGTQGGGISRYYGNAFTNFNAVKGLGRSSVWSIGEDKMKNLWVGSSEGVSRYDGKSVTNFSIEQGLSDNVVLSIHEDKAGNLWFGTETGGVSCYDGKSFINYTTAQGLAGNKVWCIAEDKTGNLWFGTETGGVTCYNGKSFINYTTAQGLADNFVFAIRKDKQNNLWFGTYGNGVSRFNGKSFTNFNTEHGLANNMVVTIMEDEKGNLWFGTQGGGISRYDGQSFLNFTTTQGLPDNSVSQVIAMDKQRIAIGTNLGVGVLKGFVLAGSGKEPYDLLPSQNNLSNADLKKYTPVFEIFNSETGYPIKDVNAGQNTMFLDSKGIIWMGTGSDKTGLVRFDYEAVHRNLNPPTVVLQNLKVNKEAICWYDLDRKQKDSATLVQQEAMTYGKPLTPYMRDSIQRIFGNVQFDGITGFYPLPENLVLPYRNNNVTFSFIAVEPSRNFLVQYQYILQGYDEDWSPVTEKTEASFGNIYEGEYTFKLKARNPDGVWSQPIEYKFRVLPPLWRTWWMYTIYGVMFIASVVVIVLANGWRLRKKARELTVQIRKATQEVMRQQEVIKEQQIRELELIAIRAQMNPHFLFNVLASIQLLINKSDVVSANNALAKFGKLMRLILENSEKQTIFLDDEIEMLKLYVEMESLLVSFTCKISIDPSLDIENVPIPTMIIQPYVENAIKHGISGLVSNKEVIINFQKRQDNLFCIIQDNGIGRQKSEAAKSKYSEHKSMGTRLSSDRLKIMNKQVASNVEIVIKDMVDDQGVPTGTRVELNLPITYYKN